MGEAWNPPFGEKNWAVILLRVKLAIKPSGSLQLERGRVCLQRWLHVQEGGGEGREHGKKWVLISALPLGSCSSCGLVSRDAFLSPCLPYSSY